MKSIAIILLCALSAGAQTKKPKAAAPAPAPAPTAPAVPAKPPADVVQPKETVDSLKLQLALQKQKAASDEAQALQAQAMQSLEPRMAPLRTEFQAQLAISKKEEDLVRKENGFGPDIVLDENFASPTFGEWIKQKGPEKK